MVRLMKIMTAGFRTPRVLPLWRDYTYNLVPGKEGILQAHMLEVCPTIAEGPISIKVQPLSMGNRVRSRASGIHLQDRPAVATLSCGSWEIVSV